MLKVAVTGASGYMGAELLRLLSVHPKVRVTAVTSERLAGERLDRSYPHLRGLSDLVFQDIHADRLAAEADVVFLALPHMESQRLMPALRRHGRKAVDLSADYRLRDASLYTTWYKAPHEDAVGLAEAVYGMPELHRKQIAGAALLASPGCYPMGAVLATAGSASVKWGGIVSKVLIPTVVAPLVGFSVGILLMVAIFWIFRHAHPGPLTRRFRVAQLASASFMAPLPSSGGHRFGDEKTTSGPVRPRRERRFDRHSSASQSLRATNAVPDPAAISSKPPNPSGARRRRSASGATKMGVPGPNEYASTSVPPAAVTRASSSKNGIMLSKTTRSNAPSGNGMS